MLDVGKEKAKFSSYQAVAQVMLSILKYRKMTLDEKQQDIIDEFAFYEDWIRESKAFDLPSGSAGTVVHP